ncbi:propionyl-CoA carboxylase beta chain, mitochondrial [Aspergillus tubingensis]|uniref:propionyl-CoA carboxylase beta chain, mitochondrial n=1 Tax=Aspergillus tubingensis TaxID=5068 RepID=UPI001577DF00|nr:propionyl-CoA carboxylase beta chain, mitochondrial [Aspergillus tubingensis]GFN12347.1 propionyl-CoA carboxylase beta chain, mitochondrial [Aspergillus tubingensis]
MNFTIINGQIYTPGLAIIDAPQPYTPLGGDTLQIAIDTSGDGQLTSSSSSSSTEFHTLHLFLTSTTTHKNLTISNGTTPSTNNTYVGPVLDLEPSSTVKHVNWIWPACFVGNGGDKPPRGDYNVSVHQSFRWDGTDYYTVFELPISVTNAIEESEERVDCAVLENEWVGWEVLRESNDTLKGQPWVSGSQSGGSGSEGESGGGDESTSGSLGRRGYRAGVMGWVVLGLVMGVVMC